MKKNTEINISIFRLPFKYLSIRSIALGLLTSSIYGSLLAGLAIAQFTPSVSSSALAYPSLFGKYFLTFILFRIIFFLMMSSLKLAIAAIALAFIKSSGIAIDEQNYSPIKIAIC
jgi:hypothetical protein